MRDDVVAVILAGGRSRRMGGGDKCLMKLGDRPLITYAIDRITPQVSAAMINTNAEPATFAPFGLPTAADMVEGYAGPLAGVLTGMAWAATNHPRAEWLVSVAADTPFFPHDLVEHLLFACRDDEADLACASSEGREHPVFGLWPMRLRDDLRQGVAERGIRKVDQWTARHRRVVVPFETHTIDPFFNINRPEDLERAHDLLAQAE